MLIILPGCQQPAKGEIKVSAVDERLTPAAGVSVTLTSEGDKKKNKKKTSSQGTCLFPALSPGKEYTLFFEKDGFISQSRQGFRVTPGKRGFVRIVLQVDPGVIPGRWRIAGHPAKKITLTPEQQREKRKLETLSYLPGRNIAPAARNVTIYNKDKAYKGLNLFCSGHGPEAILMDMKGRHLHRWYYDFSRVWQEKYNARTIQHQYWRRVFLLEKGDLLAIFEGHGLIKLDRHSNLLWRYDGSAHHDLHITPEGNLYVLTREGNLIPKYNETEIILEDFISILAPDGKEIRRVSILKCLENSAFASLLEKTTKKGDLLHTNTIEILDGKLARRSPAFKKGNVLISILCLDFIGIVDMDKESVVWGMTGMWKRQHQPMVLDNGNILIFDNLWEGKRCSRVLEFDPFSKQITWEYPGKEGKPFYTVDCGSCQRLPNGNTLISETNGGRAFEVTQDKTIAWEFYNPMRAGKNHELIASLFEVTRIDPTYNVDWLNR